VAVPFVTRRELTAQLRELGLADGDIVMVHAALRSVGPILGGPDSLIRAILDAVGPAGTLLVYTDWNDDFHQFVNADGCVPNAIRDDVQPFDPLSSRAIRDNGAFPELVRTLPGAHRSGSPGPSCAAVGGSADWLTSDHAFDYGYGERSPFAKVVETEGKVLMIGAPLDTMTILHHAEHKAKVPGKRVIRYEVPFATTRGTEWRTCEEFDTSHPVVDGLADDYFGTIVGEFLANGRGRRGTIGNAASVLVPAAGIVGFAVDWIEQRCGGSSQAGEPT
jgi:aminoglycoside 3-N-acetyltransferase